MYFCKLFSIPAGQRADGFAGRYLSQFLFSPVFCGDFSEDLILLYHKTYLHKDSREWVVFVHGAGGSSAIWFKQIRDFARQFNVLLVDLRGHGKSRDLYQKKSGLKYSFREVGKDVLEVMESLKTGPAHFVGVSLGSIVVRGIAETDPSAVRSMSLCGAITRLNLRTLFLMHFTAAIRRYIPFLWFYTIFAYILMPRRKNRESRDVFIAEAKYVRQDEFLRWFTLTAEVNPLLKSFADNELPIPTFYLMGDQDYMFLPQVKILMKRHRFSLLKVVENCGHVCNVEEPEFFNRFATAFIRLCSEDAAPTDRLDAIAKKLKAERGGVQFIENQKVKKK